MISIEQLTRKYGPTVAVDNVSLRIGRGEIVGLLGHNGAGKTTIMKILTGFLEPTAGSVSVDGIDVVSQRTLAQRKLGYLPENAPLYPEMRVGEYLWTMAELRGLPAADIPRAVADAVDATDLRDRIDQSIDSLSKGYRQRVGLAQAILHRPDVLVLDEPTNGLDPTQIHAIRGLVRRLAEHSTVILSTHILQEVEAVCDRVVILIQGRLAADASLAELLATDTLRVGLSGSPADDAVRRTLHAIDGVAAVSQVSADEGGVAWWTVELADPPADTSEIARALLDAGLNIESLSRGKRTLDEVFDDLHRAAARAGGEA